MERHLFKGFVALVLLTGVVLVLHGSEQPGAGVSGQRTNTPTVSTNDSQQAWKLMEVYFGALAKNQITNANVLVPQIMVLGTNDGAFMNFFSWRIFADRNIRHRDRQLALTTAQRALQVKGEEAGVLDTYARALFENGKREQAIEIEQKAVQLSTNEAQRIEMEANLHRYTRLSKQAK
jgi:tetratricopeptide (TPR) repeat protein